MRTGLLSFNTLNWLIAALFPILLVSCVLKEDIEQEPAKKIYAPGEIRAEDIEYIAACEVGRIENDGLNYGSNNVMEKGGLYYVSIVSRPYIASAQRTVVINDRGEVIDYKKGWKPYPAKELMKDLPVKEPLPNPL